MNLLVDTIPTSVITSASIFNFSLEEKNRREKAIKNKDFFYDRHYKHMSLINTDVDPVQVNVTAPIIKKKVSLLYSRPLVREFTGPSASITLLEQLYEDINIDCFLRNVDLLAELTGTGLVFVGLDEGQIYLRLFDSSDFSVLENEDDKTQADAVSIISVITKLVGNPKNPQASTHIKSEVWTDSYITEFIDSIRHGSKPNNLGFLPFVPFKGEDVWGQFLGHAPSTSVVLLNQTMNQQLTNLGYMLKMQSATPVVITGFERGEGIVIHPGRAISLPAGATAEVLQTNPKIADSLAQIKYIEEKIYETSSVPKVSVVGDAEAQSGRELMIKWEPLVQVFNDKTLRYKKHELELANMILRVLGAEEIEDVLISYPEEGILPLTSDAEELEKDIRLGLTTPIDEMLRRDPALSEQEAEALIRANLEFNKETVSPEPEPESKEEGKKVEDK